MGPGGKSDEGDARLRPEVTKKTRRGKLGKYDIGSLLKESEGKFRPMRKGSGPSSRFPSRFLGKKRKK